MRGEIRLRKRFIGEHNRSSVVHQRAHQRLIYRGDINYPNSNERSINYAGLMGSDL